MALMVAIPQDTLQKLMNRLDALQEISYNYRERELGERRRFPPEEAESVARVEEILDDLITSAASDEGWTVRDEEHLARALQ